jgi:leucyl aminopeptidase (aminopeptidase T)/HD-GYP domain-containing protein (c-di-GMP phosphodiesterase class II)
MSLPAISEAERTRDSRALRASPLSPSLLRAELVGFVCFVIAAALLALLGTSESVPLGAAAVYVFAIAVASNVRFDVGAGFTVPTQAVFVPMLFALPTAVVPLLVMVGLVLGMLPAVARGRIAPSWLLTAAGNSWFAIGAALVLVLAHDHSPEGREGVLLAALAVQFGFDFLAAAARDRLFEDDFSPAELAREVAPIYAVDVALSALGLVVALAATAGYGEWPVVLVAPLFLLMRIFSRERQERLEQVLELSEAYQGTALLLGDVVEADDSYTGEHSKGVVRLSLEVAEALGLEGERLRNVEFGALLHDVGKIAIPNEIINKPGSLNEREWELVKTHTIEGERMLAKIGGVMVEVGRIVRASHEAWDGSGYPDGLRGEEIPIEARIVAACDAFSAMTTTRSYRRAMTAADALAELERCAGSQFSPEVVAALVGIVGAQPAPASEPQPIAAAAGPEVLPSAPSTPPGPKTSRDAATIAAFAELAVGVGANVQPGQYVEVSGEVGHLETVRAITAAAYARGAAFVDVQLLDPVIQSLRVGGAPERDLAHVPSWERERVRDLAARGGASILVTGPTFPGLFDRLDPRRLALASTGPSGEWRDATRTINWTIVPAATPGWAAQMRPRLAIDEALSALWADLAHVCRLDLAAPAAAWQERLAALRRRAEWLAGLELAALRFRGPGTDLTVGLIPGGRWRSAVMETQAGVRFVPNLPTEEIYTTPDPRRVDGHVRLRRPAVIGGRAIPDVALAIRDGRVVSVDGPPEAEVLRQFVARDSGTARLGEVALVDAESRVAQLGETFGEILLDENATSHIALGYGFPALIPATSRQLANASDHHLDLMIGGDDVEVLGIAADGACRPLLSGGRWRGPDEKRATQDAAAESPPRLALRPV